MAIAVPHHEYRTLRYVRGEVMVRAGFASQIANTSTAIWNSFIREAHRELFMQLKMRDKHATSDITMVVDQATYALPAGVDHRRITAVNVLNNNWWIPVTPENISGAHDSVATQSSYPILWDIKDGQIEFWPEPDAAYTVRIEHYTQEHYLLDPGVDWAAATAYTLGQHVYAPGVVDYPTDWPIQEDGADTIDAFVYRCTTAGTSGGSAPAWPLTDGGTVNDNGVVWTSVENRMQVPSAEVMQIALFKAKSHYRQEDAQNSLQAALLNLAEHQHGNSSGKRYVRRVGRRRGPANEPWAMVPPKQV